MPSIPSLKECLDNSFDGISSRTYIKIPPPRLFLSILNGVENPSIKNCPVGNVSSNFVSVITRTSMLPDIVIFNSSNLFLIEFMFKVTTITLPTFLIL